jgi:hypothetical protein
MRMPKPSINIIDHSVGMVPVHLLQASSCHMPCVGQDGNRVVRMITHRVKNPGIGVRMSTHRKNPGIGTHHLKKPGMVRQMPESPESPYVQQSSTGTTRVARMNLRWRREHARGKE